MKNWDSLNIFWNASYYKYLKIFTNPAGLPTGILLATKVLFQAIHPPPPPIPGLKLSGKVDKSRAMPAYVPGVTPPGWPLISALYLFMLPTLCISFSLEDKGKIVQIGDTSTKFHIIIWSFSSMQWKESETKSIRKLSNFNFRWTKALYHNNLNNNTQESCIESRLLGDKFYCQLVLLCCYGREFQSFVAAARKVFSTFDVTVIPRTAYSYYNYRIIVILPPSIHSYTDDIFYLVFSPNV